MKGGKRGVTSPEPEIQELDQDIREAAASFVSDVIFRAKEMAQRSYQVQQAFSVVEEEDEEAVLAEEMANQPSTRLRKSSYSGPAPEIQIDLVGDRTPSPEETSTYVAPPSKPRQVKILHRVSTSSLDESYEPEEGSELEKVDQVHHNNMRNNLENSNRKSLPGTFKAGEDHECQVQQNNAQQKDNHNVAPISVCSSRQPPTSIIQHTAQQRQQHQALIKESLTVVGKSPASGATGEEVEKRRKGAKEYMCSKPASLPFADDSPPGVGPGIESPSEAHVAERVATRKSPLPDDTKCSNLKSDPGLRHFVDEYIKGITWQAQLLADERIRKSIPHAKYHSPTDGPRASVVLTVKTPDGPWYSRLRGALVRCLQSSCLCVNIGRRPDAV